MSVKSITEGMSAIVIILDFMTFVFVNFLQFVIFLKKNYLIIYFWLCWVFVSVRGLSLVVTSGGHSSLRCAGLSLSRPLLLRSTSSRRAGSVVVAHGPSCSAACGIFPDRARTRVPCIGRQTLNHCATREALQFVIFVMILSLNESSSLLLMYLYFFLQNSSWF